LMILFMAMETVALSRGGTDILKFKLDNGMNVFVKKIDGLGLVALDMWVHTGTKNEDESVCGISHFLEHMIFKGTEKRGPGELDRIVESIGGYWNAATSYDFTHFYIVAPKEHFEEALDVMADAMMNAQLAEEELKRERLVVLEEVRRKNDSPFGLLWTTLYENAYKVHPYRLPVLGREDALERINREKMMEYYKAYYVPNNMNLVIVGDVDGERILPLVKGAFAGFERKTVPNHPLPQEPPQREIRRVIIEKDVGEGYMLIAWHGPGIEEREEVYAADLLMALMGEGRTSRLYHHLREEKGLVSSIDAGFATHEDPGLFVISATFPWENFSAVEKGILEQIKQIKEGEISEEELDKAKTLVESSFAFANQTCEDQASSIGYYTTLSGDVRFYEDYVAAIKRIGARELRELAKKYLREDAYTIVVIKPKG